MHRTARHRYRVQIDTNEVGSLAHLEGADLVLPTQYCRTPQRGNIQPLFDCETACAALDSLQEHSVPSFPEQMPGVIAGRSVDAKAHVDAGISHLAYR